MTQWEAFIKMYDAGREEYFNPMFGTIKVRKVYKKVKEASFIVQGNISIHFTVNADFKVKASDNTSVKQCVFPNSDCDDFVTYVNTFHKNLLLKPNTPVCIYRPHAGYDLIFGVITKVYEDYVEVILQENGHPITVEINEVLTVKEAKELINNKDNVQSIQD